MRFHEAKRDLEENLTGKESVQMCKENRKSGLHLGWGRSYSFLSKENDTKGWKIFTDSHIQIACFEI